MYVCVRDRMTVQLRALCAHMYLCVYNCGLVCVWLCVYERESNKECVCLSVRVCVCVSCGAYYYFSHLTVRHVNFKWDFAPVSHLVCSSPLTCGRGRRGGCRPSPLLPSSGYTLCLCPIQSEPHSGWSSCLSSTH